MKGLTPIVTMGLGLCLLVVAIIAGCGGCNGGDDERPNILWICWDTVRADRMGLYGHERPNTPFLVEWAADAQVFDNCLAAANCTVPVHASWFTGLAPAEHRCTNQKARLPDAFETLAETLKTNGYRTYMFSANPHITRKTNFSQGFDLVEHPWDEAYKRAALERAAAKRAGRPAPPGAPGAHPGAMSPWTVKDSSDLARRGARRWLSVGDGERPFFIFINAMEAHLPTMPADIYRRRIMNPEQVDSSWTIEPSFLDVFAYTLRQHEFDRDELEIIGLKYDAAIAELDAALEKLLASLREGGDLDNTIVILTSDHGEHLGEHHLLDHQYSVYEPLTRVPLVIHYPRKVAAGRTDVPAMNSDLYTTLLELCGIDRPDHVERRSSSLLDLPDRRIRVVELPDFPTHWFQQVQRIRPRFDPSPWARSLRAVYKDELKLIWASNERYELYNLAFDRTEMKNLADERPDLLELMQRIHAEWVSTLNIPTFEFSDDVGHDDEERKLLESLGY